MKIITFDDIKKLNIDPDTCYKMVEEMIKDKDKAYLPPKISMHRENNVFCNVMPCMIDGMTEPNWGGVKVVNRYPLRVPSLDSRLFLMNMDTGDFVALMDANWITAMRTGAVAAHSVKLLSKKDFKTVAFMGLGNTARATMLVLQSLYKDRDLDIRLLKYKGQEELFIERFKEYKNLHFTCMDNITDLFSDAEVIISCVTYSDTDFAPDDLFAEGCTVVPVHTRGFTNCDLFFDKVFADDTGHVCHFRNFDKFRSFAEVSDVVNGRAPGRENDKERILAYNIGLSIHDIHYASYIYELLKNDPSLENIDFNNPTEKFWI